MLWLALHLPLLSLEAFCATTAVVAPASHPVALVAEHRITSRNAAAAARGVRVGMKRATALALAADLLLGEANAERDAAALRAVAHAALAFTPAVTLQDGQATVLMEVQPSLRLFGGLAALQRRLVEALAPLAHRVRIAAAPTALGAAILARLGQRVAASDDDACGGASFDPVLGPHATSLAELARLLDRAPVWLLGPGREHWEALQGMGLKVLADLRALPRSGLARRFGAGLLDDLDHAYGHAPDPRRWLELPARFEARLELHQRADNTEQVLAAAAVLLARLVAWAQARHGRIAAFTLSMQHEPRHQQRGGAMPATELRIELAAPALDPAHLQLLLRERLARVKLAAPTLELRLRCRELVAGAPPNGELFPTRGSEAIGLARLLERLRARLGDAQVQCLEPVADHRPERASRGVNAAGAASVIAAAGASKAASHMGAMAAVAAARGSGTWAAAAAAHASMATKAQPRAARAVAELPAACEVAGPPSACAVAQRPAARAAAEPPSARTMAEPPSALPLHRPVWLLPDSLPLAERDALPLLDGQPLQLLAGPERIEAGWWDGATAARDYFIALAADGSLVWVWRSRLPAAAALDGEGNEGRQAQWMLQGRFA